MAKIIDITDKLNFEQKPQMKIKATVITVNDEAVAMLKIMPKMNENITPETIAEICDVLFDKPEIEKIQSLKLNFSGFIKLIEAAIELVAGTSSGEAVTPGTT